MAPKQRTLIGKSRRNSVLIGCKMVNTAWSTKCTHKFRPVLLKDGPTEQYFVYEFDTTSVCASGINLQACTS